jgi:hypothetical protein
MRKFVLAAVLVLMAGGAQAATLNVVGGQLFGASGVLVDGSLYDVQFLDGTCIDLYNGCDEASDFTFQTQASAVLASWALLDQVFLDGVEGQFDSFPQLTNGCTSLTECTSLTPYPPPIPHLLILPARNGSTPNSDVVLNSVGGSSVSLDLAGFPDGVYAVWSPTVIPEPSTALLLSLGLTGLAAKGRRRNRS